MIDEDRSRPRHVPALLDAWGAWAWRLIVIAVALYLLLHEVIARLKLVFIPLATAILLTALLYPVTALLRRWRWPRGAAAGATLLGGLALIGGVGTYVVNQAIKQYPQFVSQVSDLVRQAQDFLVTGPIHLKKQSIDNLGNNIVTFLQARQASVASGVISAIGTAVEVLTGLLLTLFLTFFLLYDGQRIWSWLVGLFPARADGSAQDAVRDAGDAVWRTLTGYVVGTFTVAAFHASAMGATLAILGVPLFAPLVLLIFIGSFIPIVGIVVFGGLAVLVALVSKGAVTALILLVVLLVENQVESHLLQPMIVGRYVHLHPIVIALVLTGAAVIAGIPGAIFGVPLVASGNAAVGALRARERGEPPAGSPPTPDAISDPTTQTARSDADGVESKSVRSGESVKSGSVRGEPVTNEPVRS